MKTYRLVILIVVVLLLQVGFLPAWRPFGVVPDLLLATIIALAFSTTASETLACAMTVGLALDLASGADFGLRLGFYTVAALVVSLLNRSGIAFDSLVWRLGLAVVLVVLEQLAYLLDLLIHGVGLEVGVIIVRLSITVVIELVLMIVMGAVVKRLTQREDSLPTVTAPRGR